MLFLDQSKPNAHLLMKLGLAKKLMARGSFGIGSLVNGSSR
jgi:hypothetical protein